MLVNGGAVTDLCPLTASVASESIVPTAATFVVQPALTPNNGCDNGINYDSSEDNQGGEEEIADFPLPMVLSSKPSMQKR